MKRALLIGDPLKTLHFESDSSLYMAELLQQEGVKVSWAETKSIVALNHEPLALASELKRVSVKSASLQSRPRPQELEAFDLILIRQDPPFNLSYVKLCWLLQLLPKQIPIMNKPSTLLLHHEKSLSLEAVRLGFVSEDELIPSLVMPREGNQARIFVKEFLKAHLKVPHFVVKPFWGYQGMKVKLVERKKILSTKWKGDEVVQPFIESVRYDGDLRVFFIEGRYAGHFVRRPKRGSILANLAQGGTADWRPLDTREESLVSQLESFLSKVEIDIAGVDLIGGKLNEINITSPTGLRTLERLAKASATRDAIKKLFFRNDL